MSLLFYRGAAILTGVRAVAAMAAASGRRLFAKHKQAIQPRSWTARSIGS
jgi:hypothetical protein